ncbi:MAG: tRNA threonylcarbamoyladenosine dehydratase [Alphaproteobacteria bacterium]|nr:tRNA threonylcarbamoyladenosine dehydratase [Alphaproteobacteria bacterium]
MDRLHRTRLLFGDDGIQKLQKSTVMVVGCGAVGSFAIEALARTGIGRLIVVDFDCVDASNINRQLFALESTVGLPKVDVARARIHDINPDTTVSALNIFFDENTQLSYSPDYIIDAIDTVDSKIALYRWADKHNIPLIASMGAASKTDITKIKVDRLSKTSVCPLASRVRKLVRENSLPDIPVVYSTQQPAPVTGHAKNLGSIITVTGTFGLMLANYVVQEIIQNK